MDLSNKKVLIYTQGGSHAYGLNTPQSDVDYRGIFVDTDADHLVGLRKNEVLTSQKTEDVVMTEFRHALSLLRNANTQMIELLYATNWLAIDDIWREVMTYRSSLVDSEKLFNSLRGYMLGERRLANGERTGRLGGKRKTAIDTFGFSPKNFVQLFRLAWAGETYFLRGFFPVNVAQENRTLASELLDIKTNPRNHTKEELNRQADNWEKRLCSAYHDMTTSTVFDERVATRLCLEVYRPIIMLL